MNRIATLNLAEIETVVGGVDTSLLTSASLLARKVPSNGGTGYPTPPQLPSMPIPTGTMNLPR
ncbi:MAG: hypothetical protein U1E23_00470 [Reyranellaceae bacterium]